MPDELMDAVNAAVESATPGGNDAPATVDTTPDDVDSGAGQPAGDAVADSGEQPSGATEPESGTAGDGAEGEGGDGTDQPAATPEATLTPEQQAEKDKKAAEEAAAAAKPVDHINDPIDGRLTAKTQERIRSLVTSTKEQTARAERAEYNLKELVDNITATGANPQQYGQTLDYLGLVNSKDPKKLEAALAMAQNEVAAIAQMLGRSVPGVDFLQNFPDLKAAVAANQISEDYAHQLAAARAQQVHHEDVARAEQSANTQRMQAEQRTQAARAALTALGNQLQASDPHYVAKKNALVPILQPIFKTLPPEQWVSAFQNAYARFQYAPPAPKPAAVVPQNQPLRAKTPAGAPAAVPKTLAEAIDFGITQAGR